MVFLFLLPVLVTSKFCYKYQCGDDSKFPSNNTCIQYADDIFYVRACPEADDYCAPAEHPTHAPTNCTKLNPTNPQNYPGDPCQNDNDCFSTGTCVSNKCKGKLEGTGCGTNTDCDVGLYCSTGTC